ncbi:DUF4935 domain-containing protein [Pontibacter sp. FD36]|uniref:PIN domain-containing protein n=1 Tax=Pontibacter sp. FD36 TaxID=2789860 RepID=UPI0018AA4976|nr:PIN domain-containing protein [Pontibacter sp. FD36]MBF8962995.1 DUF4935 domain-containing protein [Pontibacter sp. FD36]
MARKVEKLDAYIFIDTNIFLDFYRIRRTDISLKYLEEIIKHKEIIITSSQIEMEFKKNRQSAILESIAEVKKNSSSGLSVPAILSDEKAVEMIQKNKKAIDGYQKKLKQKIENIFANPNSNDPVYKSLQKVFSNNSTLNLNRENEQRFAIRRLALKRFMLGYPPRKSADNSIGDAINWEWIMRCAETTQKNIIIVTRDSDYGAIYDNNSYLNDWLSQEFKLRTSIRRKLILTDKLSYAFKLVEIPVTKEMIEEEETIIKESLEDYHIKKLKELVAKFRETSKNIDDDKKESND